MNDVELSPGPKTLLFDKHIEYIANHGNDQNDFVSIFSIQLNSIINNFDFKTRNIA